MITAELIGQARAAGLELIDHGATLRVSGPRPLPSDLVDALREYKGEILEHLRYQPETLPSEEDPRRVLHGLINEVWAADGWLLITGDHVRVVHGASSERLTPELLARVEAHQAGLLRALTRIPDGSTRKEGR